jgi:predicted dehydrogenase
VDELFVGQMRFPDDVFAQFDCSFRVDHRTGIEIVGSEGTITVKRPFTPRPIEVIEVKQGEKTDRIIIHSGSLYAGEVADMHNAILNGTAPRISLLDSRRTVKTITALLRSAKENKPVAVKE